MVSHTMAGRPLPVLEMLEYREGARIIVAMGRRVVAKAAVRMVVPTTVQQASQHRQIPVASAAFRISVCHWI